MPHFQPENLHTVTPRIIARDWESLVQFLKDVFQAHAEIRAGAPTEVRIGDSVILVSGGDGLREAMAAFLYVYVEDTDVTYRRALAAKAISVESPIDTPYGDRRAMVKDAWGNTWQIATHQRPSLPRGTGAGFGP
jgi:PhnB protein